MPEQERHRQKPEPMGALDEDDAAREARIRGKFDRGEPLSPDEADFLARLPAVHEMPPAVVQESARRHGGVEPIDASTGLPHDPHMPARLDRSTARRPPGPAQPDERENADAETGAR